MPQLSGWRIMLGVIATGFAVGVIFEPKHIIPLMVWTLMAAGICMGIEKVFGRRG